MAHLCTRILRHFGAACLTALVLSSPAPSALARHAHDGADVPPFAGGQITASELPPEARRTLSAIQAGGPFAYAKDGAVFGNFEKRLPLRYRGYYREYTVDTPGAHNRGPRRIIAGQGPLQDVRHSGEYYYTDDHYRSFRQIRP